MAPPNPSTETLHENSLDDNNMIDFDALIWYDDGLTPVETELDFRTDSLKAGPADGDYGLLQNLYIPDLVKTDGDQLWGNDVEMFDGSSASTCNC